MQRGGNDSTLGGGFFNVNQIDSPARAKPKGGARRSQSVTPIVIRQLRDSSSDEFKIFGKPTQIVVLVGILREYEVQSTRATYEIEDHTGKISAIWWLDNEANGMPNLPNVREGRYCQVFGSVRNQDGRKIIMILKMFPVEDINVITTHLLQVIHTRLEAEAMNKEGGAISKIHARNPGADLANSMSFMDTNSGVGQFGLTPLQEKIIRILQPVESLNGLSRQQVMQHFPPNMHHEVSNALDFMVSEGHAYSTIDTDHFRVTDVM